MSGNVGRAFRNQERWRTDEAYREKRRIQHEKSRAKNKEQYREYKRKFDLELTIFRNRKCKVCKKLLNWKTKGRLCKVCRWIKPEKPSKVTIFKLKVINLLKSIKPKSI